MSLNYNRILNALYFYKMLEIVITFLKMNLLFRQLNMEAHFLLQNFTKVNNNNRY